jgi:hypothetical protein
MTRPALITQLGVLQLIASGSSLLLGGFLLVVGLEDTSFVRPAMIGFGLLFITMSVTTISVALLKSLSKPDIRVLFSEDKPEELSPEEIAQRNSLSTGGAGTVLAIIAIVLVAVFVIGCVATAIWFRL